MWLDPSLGYAARQFIVTQDSETLDAGKTIFRNLKITDFQKISDTYFPKSYNEEKHVVGLTYEQKRGKPIEKLYVSKGKREVNFTDIKVNLLLHAKDFTLTSSIADGTDAYMSDAPQIKHVWLDGKIVPWTDELALRIAKGHGFIMGVSTPRFWLMALGIGMIAIAIGAKTREYFKKRQGVE